MTKLKIWLPITLVVIVAVITATFFIGSGDKKNAEPNKEVEKEKGREGAAIIWEVKSETATVYIIGAVHVGKQDMHPMPQALLDAFYDSDIIAFEVISEPFGAELEEYMNEQIRYNDGTTIKDHVSLEIYEMLQEYIGSFPDEVPEDWHLYKPIFLAGEISYDYSTIDLQTLSELMTVDRSLGVEGYFEPLAYKYQKEVLAIEGDKYKFDMELNYSPALQEYFLKESLQNALYGNSNDIIEEFRYNSRLLDLWRDGDAEGIRDYSIEEVQMEIEAMGGLFEEYYNVMITQRNNNMVKMVIDMLDGNKNVFFAPGVFHVVGENGILDQLKDMGYTVTRL